MRTRLRRLEGAPLTRRIWVFGYGSLIWRPDFPFAARRVAHLADWSRRFWQGSHDHRGVPEAPGRVVTLVRESGARCLGNAYLVDEAVFAHLDHREKNGYERFDVSIEIDSSGVDAVTYIAPPDNHAYLGPAPLDDVARQIVSSHGPSGSNLEYLLRLAQALRDLDARDDHVFELEARVRALIRDANSPGA